MPGNFTITSRNQGDILTSSIYNSDRQDIVDHLEPQYIDDESANLAGMQATTDPGELSSESLATTLQGEIKRLRYAIQEIKAFYDSTLTRWYQSPTRLSIAQGTITSAIPSFSGTATWNSGGTTFTGILENITDTSSAAASLLMDLQVASTSKFKVSKAGLVTAASSLVAPTIGPNSAQVHTLPAVSSDTVALIAATQTLTGKTYDTAGSGNVFKINGTTISDKTGTGKAVLDTSPTLNTTVVLADACNIVANTGTGSKIGTATTQKLGFWNATPVAQQSAYTQTYATADKTHANFTSSDLTGISSSTTGAALAEPDVGYVQATWQQNMRRIQDQFVALRADVADLKQLVNSVIDDLQTIGLLA